METTKEYLQRITEEIDQEISDYIKNEDEGVWGVKDGIINIDLYADKNPKILWILKDAYESDGDGGFDLKKWINDKNSSRELNPTERNMAYIAYGVYNNVSSYDEIAKAKEIDLLNSLKSIAYINLKKLPITDGGKRSNMADIHKAYDREHDKRIIHRQLKEYLPNIVIAGGTIEVLKDWNLTDQKKISGIPYYEKDGQFYLAAYHPSYVAGKKARVENIITAIRQLISRLTINKNN